MSTVHAAAERVEQISSADDGQSVCAGVFIDLRKAFNTVDHELLVEKLNVYDIRGVANKWLQNYLICLICWRYKHIMFRKKSYWFATHSKSWAWQALVWFSVNKLSVNLSKTNYILFRNRSADTDLNICINTINVTRVQSSKFLGIIIDENLNWKPHIQLVKSKLSKTLSIKYLQSFQTHLLWGNVDPILLFILTVCHILLRNMGNTYATNVNCI